MVALSGHMQGRETVLCFGVDGGVSGEEQLDDLLVTRPGSAMKRSETVTRFDVNLGAVIEQQVDTVSLAPFGGHVEWSDVLLAKRRSSSHQNQSAADDTPMETNKSLLWLQS